MNDNWRKSVAFTTMGEIIRQQRLREARASVARLKEIHMALGRDALDRALYAKIVGCHIEAQYWLDRATVHRDICKACDNEAF